MTTWLAFWMLARYDAGHCLTLAVRKLLWLAFSCCVTAVKGIENIQPFSHVQQCGFKTSCLTQIHVYTVFKFTGCSAFCCLVQIYDKEFVGLELVWRLFLLI